MTRKSKHSLIMIVSLLTAQSATAKTVVDPLLDFEIFVNKRLLESLEG